MTEKELADLLAKNPELSADDPWIRVSPSATVQAGKRKPKVKTAYASEHELQKAIIEECDRRALHNPEWSLVFAIPNGGHRHPAVAGKLKAEGVRPGIPDLFVPLMRHGYGGAFVELKHGDGKPSQLQMEWVRKLQEAGYWAGVFWEFDKVMRFLEWYIVEG